MYPHKEFIPTLRSMIDGGRIFVVHMAEWLYILYSEDSLDMYVGKCYLSSRTIFYKQFTRRYCCLVWDARYAECNEPVGEQVVERP